MKNIWLIGGTKDSRELARRISEKKTSRIIVSTSSKYGKKLIEGVGLDVIDKKMDLNEMENLVMQREIQVIVDASHPYAQNVSKNSMEVAKKHGIRYLRFEREMISYEGALRFDNIDSIVDYLNSNYFCGNILSTIGVNNLHKLKNLKMLDKLYVRILPVKASIEIAENLDYQAKNIIALQGPFSKEFNKDIMRNYGIKYMITKESGIEGGELEKVEACKDLGIEILVLKRPKLEYINIFKDMNEVIEEL